MAGQSRTRILCQEGCGIEPAIVRFDAHTAERKTKAHAGSIGPSLLEGAKQLVDIPVRETAALVLDLDEHAFGAGTDPEHNGGPRSRELEGVLQRIHHDSREDLPVSLNDHALVDRHHA